MPVVWPLAAVTQTGSAAWIVLGRASLAVAFACAGAIAGDIFVGGRRQPMAIMDLVWPVTALYWGPVAAWFYFRRGRATAAADAGEGEYWLMMQVGMVVGFFTAWPVNAWLVKTGAKEKM